MTHALPSVSAATAAKVDSVRARLRALQSVLVAYSGGADSALVLALAHEELGERCLAVMGLSAAYPRDEVEAARATAAHIGAPMLEVDTGQMQDAAFLRNDSRRCFHCRTDLFSVLGPVAAAQGLAHICDGTNADDLGDHRPGRAAGVAAGVITPLADAALTKAEVRAVSRGLGLPTWDRPQNACLSSRIPRGTPITLQALSRVERAEAWLRRHGFRQVRVREHGEMARIEVEADEVARLCEQPLRAECAAALRDLGYVFVAVDMEGFASGRLNRLIPADEREQAVST